MYIEILVLSHLPDNPTHGYELRHRVEGSTGIRLHNNALYPALRRFEEAGAVVKEAVQQQGHSPRRVYEVTDLGREMLDDLLVELPVDLAGDETEFLTRVGQFGFLTETEQLSVLAGREEALGRKVKYLTALLDRADVPVWGRRVVEELLRRVDTESAWLEHLRMEISQASAGGVAP